MRHLIFIGVAVFIITSHIPSISADDAAEAQKLIDKAVKAFGGKAAIERTRHAIIHDSGTYYGMGDGLPYTGRYVSQLGERGRYRMEILGVFIQVIDGEKAWMSAGGDTSEVTGDALKSLQAGMQVNWVTSLIPLQNQGDEYALGLAKPETIDEEECPGITVDRKDLPTVTIYFSPKSGLISKHKHKNKAAELGFQEVTEEAVIHEYKEFDGIPTPVRMTMFRDGKKFIVSNPTKVSYPKKLDDAEFAKP